MIDCPEHPVTYDIACSQCQYKASLDFYVGKSFRAIPTLQKFGEALVKSSTDFLLQAFPQVMIHINYPTKEIDAALSLCSLDQ